MNAGVSDMNAVKLIKWGVAMLLLAAAGIGNVWADHGYHGHGHTSFGVTIGVPWGPWYYPSPYPYYYQPSPPIVIERTPPVYIEQSAPPSVPQAAQNSYWYYCNASNAYYPYVNECPSGWQRVSPQPPSRP